MMFLKKAVKNTVKGMAGTMMDMTDGAREGLVEAVQGMRGNVTTFSSSAAHLAKDAGRDMKIRIAKTDNRLLAGMAIGALAVLALGIFLKKEKSEEERSR